MPDRIQNPTVTYDVILPDGERRNRKGTLAGFYKGKKEVHALALQSLRKGSKVENIRVFAPDGKELDTSADDTAARPVITESDAATDNETTKQ